MAAEQLTLIYILGTARSGSTILSAILGTDPHFLASGELARAFQPGSDESTLCACGAGPSECEFWAGVLANWGPAADPASLEGFSRQMGRLLKFGALPRVYLSTRATANGVADLIQGTGDLLQALRARSGCSAIVDSSKSIPMALLYSRIPGLELKVIHLVRNPCGFIWSQLGRRQRLRQLADIPRASTGYLLLQSLRWLMTNLACEWIVRDARLQSIRVRYEDLVSDPQASLSQIGASLGLDLQAAASLVAQGGFGFGHMISGNRVRLAGRTRLKLDQAWRVHLPPRVQRLIGLIAWPLGHRYGYQVGPA